MSYKMLKIVANDARNIDRRRLIDLPIDWEPLCLEDQMIEVRADGDLENHALYLPNKWDWVLGKDANDVICLVPLLKEEEKKDEQ